MPMFVATKEMVHTSIVEESRLVQSNFVFSLLTCKHTHTHTHTHQCYKQLSTSSAENESHMSINQDPELTKSEQLVALHTKRSTLRNLS